MAQKGGRRPIKGKLPYRPPLKPEPMTATNLPARQSSQSSEPLVVTVDVGNMEFVEIQVNPKTGTVADIMQELWRWGKNMRGSGLATKNRETLSTDELVSGLGSSFKVVELCEGGERYSPRVHRPRPHPYGPQGKEPEVKSKTPVKTSKTGAAAEILTPFKQLKVMVSQLNQRMDSLEKQNVRILALVKSVRDQQKKTERDRFRIDDSPFKFSYSDLDELQSGVAKLFCLSLGRKVSDEALKAIIVDVMRESDKAKLGAAMKWSRKKFSVFKTDERRKVLGITPYTRYRGLPTRELTRSIMRSMRAPLDFTVERTYRKHLALLRKFVRDDGSASAERGELYNLFGEWVGNNYPSGLTHDDWEGIMSEDATSSLNDGVSDSNSSADEDN